MKQKRLDNNTTDKKNNDVSEKNGFLNQIVNLFSDIGILGTESFKGFGMLCSKGGKLLASETLDILKTILGLFKSALKALTEPFRNRVTLTFQMQKALRRAKKKGKKAYALELFKCIGTYLFGEGGILYTTMNYALPIVCTAFLIGVISYGSGLDYAICVEYNGVELGVINAETDFDNASREVQQRIAHADSKDIPEFPSKLTLKIVSEDEIPLSVNTLADKMLAVSDNELTEAYGIYIDGEFIGAVADKAPVETALAEELLNFKIDGNAKNIEFSNKIEYTSGVYLTDSVMSEKKAIDMLTAKKEIMTRYTVQDDESPLIVCLKHSMSLETFMKYNRNISSTLHSGDVVTVTETERFLPIQYTRELESISLVDYDSVEVETSSLNIGRKAVLVRGQKGERKSTVEVTYVNGLETSRKIIGSQLIKAPVTEQIGIGTYSAKPASPSTMLFGTGEFSWPVDGGFISDTFISNRNHKGIDIAAPGGSDIYAAADGVVVSAGWNNGGYGYMVLIEHENGYQTRYAHASALFVAEGQTVTRGQLIAAVGTTGNSTGNHCHFEVIYQGKCYDPARYINTVHDAENSQ